MSQEDATLVAQVQLALSILSGRVRALNPDQEKLLGLEGFVSPDAMLIAAEEVIAEVILASLPAPPQEVDLQEVAVSLLYAIRDAGGVLLRKDVIMLPGLPVEDILKELEYDRVIARGDGGLRWGMNAERAIRDYEQEKLP